MFGNKRKQRNSRSIAQVVLLHEAAYHTRYNTGMFTTLLSQNSLDFQSRLRMNELSSWLGLCQERPLAAR